MTQSQVGRIQKQQFLAVYFVLYLFMLDYELKKLQASCGGGGMSTPIDQDRIDPKKIRRNGIKFIV